MIRFLAVLALFALTACDGRTYRPAGGTDDSARILVMGDSLLAWNRLRGGSVARVLAERLGQPVKDNSESAASYDTQGAEAVVVGSIQAQYQRGNWDWVIIGGGGNNLLFDCKCGACDGVLDRLVSADGRSGAIPATVARARSRGARVIYSGYLRTPGFSSPVEHCSAIGDRFDQRLAVMAARDPGVTFMPLADLVQRPGDTSFHFPDRVHPSLKGSAAIAGRIAAIMGR